jgi:hypothetical protein
MDNNLREAIGYDASKDWEYHDDEEYRENGTKY